MVHFFLISLLAMANMALVISRRINTSKAPTTIQELHAGTENIDDLFARILSDFVPATTLEETPVVEANPPGRARSTPKETALSRIIGHKFMCFKRSTGLHPLRDAFFGDPQGTIKTLFLVWWGEREGVTMKGSLQDVARRPLPSQDVYANISQGVLVNPSDAPKNDKGYDDVYITLTDESGRPICFVHVEVEGNTVKAVTLRRRSESGEEGGMRFECQ